MIRKGYFYLWSAAAAILFLAGSCNDASPEPCTYSSEKVQMRITQVLPDEKHPGEFIVILEFDGSSLAEESQSLANLRHIKITEKYLNDNPFIMEGITLTGTVHEIDSGNCEPLFIDWDQRFIE